ncbi:putative rna polymerase i specific transcription initiation factor rrn3 superfamily [Phaeomoniella chlamydospora]|uniref:Putative rna polymerase i specific transcription initiation factor rrn3 superfamily n=1 Tax=Phaeomoniella chlamydospora TaxID=158046 RepID=A0A0G2GD12_PHACM|nr:putative rna polymerase i specific transcription initiation factor rrn3 superfamily [Phaeomoniella chlamydospora]
MDDPLFRTPSSPTKRQKVSFDPDVEVVTMDDDWELDPLVVREEVRRAIQQHLNGDNDAYDRIKGIFKTDPNADNAAAPNVVKAHLQAILANVALLDKNCNGLVNALCFTEWVGRDAQFVSLYTKFLGNLAAAQSGYLGKIFDMLVDVLADVKSRRIPSFPAVRLPLMQSRAHAAIQYLLQLIPVGSNVLSKILARRLQYKPDPEKLESDIIVTKNALKMLGYAPELKADVLAAITGELVKVDVQVQVDLEDLDDNVGDDLVQDVALQSSLKYPSSQILHDGSLSEELIECESEDDSDSEDDDDVDPRQMRLKIVRANIEKVDSLIDLLFQYYDPLLRGSLEVRENTIDLLLSHFHNIILPTYRSRHSQFLIFHFAQTDPLLIDRFATSCIQVIFDRRQPPVLRQSAAAYLASFVARGAHVPPTVVRDVFDLLGGQLDSMRKEYEPSCRGPDLRRYSSFYSMTQALMYMFCFRWRELTSQAAEDEDLSDFEDDELAVTFPPAVREPLYQAIFSKLNPLRVCSPDIVDEFARVAHRLRFIYVYSKLELNKNVRLSSFRAVSAIESSLNGPDRDSSGWGQSTILEPYFPFDPYLLPRSKKWIDNDYQEWRGLPGDDQEEELDSELEDTNGLDEDFEGIDDATGTDEDYD